MFMMLEIAEAMVGSEMMGETLRECRPVLVAAGAATGKHGLCMAEKLKSRLVLLDYSTQPETRGMSPGCLPGAFAATEIT